MQELELKMEGGGLCARGGGVITGFYGTSNQSKPYHISLSLSPLSPHVNYDRGLPLSPCLVLVAGGIQ